MTNKEQRFAVARACGIYALEEESELWSLMWPDGRYCSYPDGGLNEDHAWAVCCPRFDQNIDDMTSAEKCVGLHDPANTMLRVKWINALRQIVSRRFPKNKVGISLVSDVDLIFATVDERREAFLKAMNLWTEGPKEIKAPVAK